MYTPWKHKFRSVQWDTPMSIEVSGRREKLKTTHDGSQKEFVTVGQLATMRHAWEKNSTRLSCDEEETTKPGPLVLELPVLPKKLMAESDNKTIVDWVNDHAYLFWEFLGAESEPCVCRTWLL